MADRPLGKILVDAAKGYRQFWDDNMALGIGLGFVPGLGTALAAVDLAAASIDPDAGKLETGLTAAGLVPFGRGVGAARKLIGGRKSVATAEEAKAMIKASLEEKGVPPGIVANLRLSAEDKAKMAERTGGAWTEPVYSKSGDKIVGRAPAYEISDAGFNSSHYDAWKKNLGSGPVTVPLGTVVEHEELFKRYPRLRSMKVTITDDLRANGAYDPSTGTIFIKPDAGPRTMLHELQHAVSEIEEFSPGLAGYNGYRNLAFRGAYQRLRSEGLTELEAEKLADQVAKQHTHRVWAGNYGERTAEAVARKWEHKNTLPVYDQAWRGEEKVGLLSEVSDHGVRINMETPDSKAYMAELTGRPVGNVGPGKSSASIVDPAQEIAKVDPAKAKEQEVIARMLERLKKDQASGAAQTLANKKPLAYAQIGPRWDPLEGMGNTPNTGPDFEYRGGFVREMTPKQFIMRTPGYGVDKDDRFASLAKGYKEGKPMAPPNLDVVWNPEGKFWRVRDHEGRHRSLLVSEEHGPETMMPVRIMPYDASGNPMKRGEGLTDEMRNAPIYK